MKNNMLIIAVSLLTISQVLATNIAISNSGSQVILSWPLAGTNDFYLQSATNLSSRLAWSNASDPATNGSNLAVTNQPTSIGTFYRLQAWEVLFDGTNTSAFRSSSSTLFPSNSWYVTNGMLGCWPGGLPGSSGNPVCPPAQARWIHPGPALPRACPGPSGTACREKRSRGVIPRGPAPAVPSAGPARRPGPTGRCRVVSTRDLFRWPCRQRLGRLGGPARPCGARRPGRWRTTRRRDCRAAGGWARRAGRCPGPGPV